MGGRYADAMFARGQRRVFSSGWIAVTVIGAAGIVLIWLAYPMDGECLLSLPAPPCGLEARLAPAIVGSLAIVVFWLAGTILRSRSTGPRPDLGRSRLWGTLTVVAAIVAPVITFAAGGFSIPPW